MSKIYDCMRHGFVTIAHPVMPGHKRSGEHLPCGPEWCDEAWRGTHEIVLHTGTRVWIASGYEAEGHPDVKRVGDGLCSGFDDHGGCILSVPAAWCTFHTESEAHDIEMMRDADERLLGYAL